MKRMLRAVGIGLGFVLVLGLLFFVLPSHPPMEPAYVTTANDAVRPYQVLRSEEALEDVNCFVSRLLEVHPNPYRFTDEAEFHLQVQAVNARIKAAETIMTVDLYQLLRELSGLLRDEHVTLQLPNMVSDHRFPFPVRIYQGTAYIHLAGPDGIPNFFELVAINEVPAEDIIDTLAKFQNSALEHRRMHHVEQDFSRLSIFFAWEDYTVQYFDGETVRSTTAIVTPASYQQSAFTPYRSYYLDSNRTIPVLELNSFWGFHPAEYREFIDQFFQETHDKDVLVIDIRQNGGGNADFGHYVLSHLTDRPYTTYQQFDYKISDVLLNAFRYDVELAYYQMGLPNLLWRLPLYRLEREYGRLLTRLFAADMGTVISDGPFQAQPHSTRERFAGEVFLIIGNYTGSAAIDMAAAFKYNDFGTVIGQETSHPHSYFGNTGRSRFELPNSKVRFAIPITFSLSAKGYDDQRGVVPDIPIEYSLDEYLHPQGDRELEYVLSLLSR